MARLIPGPADTFAPPDAIIISGPEFYTPHITRLYGGYKRTKNLYSRVTYQKDPDQGGPGIWEAYIYWSAVDGRFCVGPQLGATIGELVSMPKASCGSPKVIAPFENTCAVLIYQTAAEDDAISPSLMGSWAVNLYGSGPRYQVDHMLTFEALSLPAEAADPARDTGGYMHICARKFIDHEFPPKVTSIIGDAPPFRTPSANRPYAESATWVRASVLACQEHGPLLTAATEPRGDWLEGVVPERAGLYSMFATIREYPGHLEMLFADNLEASSEGRYIVWLFDIWIMQWRRITVDEYVPVIRNNQGVIEPCVGGHGRALWALLLEKALAKLSGSYDALRRADCGPLLMALTGEVKDVRQWRQDSEWWSQNAFVMGPEPQPLAPTPLTDREKTQPGVHRRVQKVMPLRMHVARVGGTWQQGPDLFATMRNLHRANAVIYVYRDVGVDVLGEMRPGYEDPAGNGLVCGHGYSLLNLVEAETDQRSVVLRLVQLRNPWGPGRTWRGAWAEGSLEWDKHPEVRRHHLRAEHQVTGRFWMAWPDFCEMFDRVEVCPMPGAARKSSYVPRQLRGDSDASPTKAREWGSWDGSLGGRSPGGRSPSGGGSPFWACCTVQSLLKTQAAMQRTPYHPFCCQILQLMVKEGLVRGYTVEGNKISVLLKHYQGAPVIRNVRVVSKPSRDIWLLPHELKFRTRHNTGLWIMQTPLGVVSHRDCIEMGIGGKVIFAVNNGYQQWC